MSEEPLLQHSLRHRWVPSTLTRPNAGMPSKPWLSCMVLMLSVAQSPGFEGVKFMDLQSLHLRPLTVTASVLLVSALMLNCTTF